MTYSWCRACIAPFHATNKAFRSLYIWVVIVFQYMFDDHDNNILKPKQNNRHFPDKIFKCFFLNEAV